MSGVRGLWGCCTCRGNKFSVAAVTHLADQIGGGDFLVGQAVAQRFQPGDVDRLCRLFRRHSARDRFAAQGRRVVLVRRRAGHREPPLAGAR
jgi:hypothetical protein